MSESTENPTVELQRRIMGDVITGVPVYEGLYDSLEDLMRYKIIIIPPASTQDRIYKTVVRMSYIHLLPGGEREYVRGAPEETYWGYRMDTVKAWIEVLIGAEIIMHTGEQYTK